MGQYVNYSNITLKGLGTAGGKNQTADNAVASDIEAKINAEILRCPECGRCSACTEKTARRKLCKERLDVREKLIAAVCKVPSSAQEKGKKTSKKRKAEPASNSNKKAPTTAASKSPPAGSKGGGGKKSPKLMMKKALLCPTRLSKLCSHYL